MRKIRSKPAPFKDISVNFMTPTILGYYSIGDGVYVELSEGEGIYREPIFGVTVRPDENGKSKLFHSLVAATSYIEKLED